MGATGGHAAGLYRLAPVAIVASMTLATGLGVVLNVTKNTPTVSDDIIATYRTSSGGQVMKIGTGGTITTSGGLVTAAGVTIRGNLSGSTLTVDRTISPQYIGFSYSGSLVIGSGKILPVMIPTMTGFNLAELYFVVTVAGTTNTSRYTVRNVTKNRRMLSTDVSIDSTEVSTDTAQTPAVINTANDDVSGKDQLAIDFSTQSTTAPQGLSGYLKFVRP